MGAWAVYRLAQAQGLVDLMLAGSNASPPAVLHLLVCVDLSQGPQDLGGSVAPFPQRYV